MEFINTIISIIAGFMAIIGGLYAFGQWVKLNISQSNVKPSNSQPIRDENIGQENNIGPMIFWAIFGAIGGGGGGFMVGNAIGVVETTIVLGAVGGLIGGVINSRFFTDGNGQEILMMLILTAFCGAMGVITFGAIGWYIIGGAGSAQVGVVIGGLIGGGFLMLA